MLGELPEGWREAKLGDHCRIEIGGTPSRDKPQFWSNEDAGHPWVSIADLKSPSVDRTKEFISDLGVANSNVKPVPRGTVMMSFKLTIGRTAVAGRDLYTNEAIAAFFPDRDIDNEFLFYALPHAAGRAETDQAIKGATLNKAKLRDLTTVLPPLDEQRRIAEVLRSVEEAILLNGRTVDQAVVALSAAREHLTGQDGSETDWALQPILDCFQLQRGHDLPVQSRSDGNVPVIASNGPVGFHDHAPIPAPAVITGRSGTIGKVTYFDGPCWPLNTTLFVRDFKGSDPRFVYHFLSSFPLSQHATGTGVPTLNRNDVHAVEVRWPEPEEQSRRRQILDGLEAAYFSARAALEASRKLKATLARDLLSGRVRVPA